MVTPFASLLATCPICHGAGTITDTYMEHGDWIPIVSQRGCYYCKWVRVWVLMHTVQAITDAINEFQANASFHPLTCGTGSHNLTAMVTSDGVELICPTCGWQQAYIPLFIFELLRLTTRGMWSLS